MSPIRQIIRSLVHIFALSKPSNRIAFLHANKFLPTTGNVHCIIPAVLWWKELECNLAKTFTRENWNIQWCESLTGCDIPGINGWIWWKYANRKVTSESTNQKKCHYSFHRLKCWSGLGASSAAEFWCSTFSTILYELHCSRRIWCSTWLLSHF